MNSLCYQIALSVCFIFSLYFLFYRCSKCIYVIHNLTILTSISRRCLSSSLLSRTRMFFFQIPILFLSCNYIHFSSQENIIIFPYFWKLFYCMHLLFWLHLNNTLQSQLNLLVLIQFKFSHSLRLYSFISSSVIYFILIYFLISLALLWKNLLHN